MLRLAQVGRRFAGGVEALRCVSFALEAGDFTALLGPSGCGKSTLLRLIAGFEAPDAGCIAWQGAPPRPGEIGFVFQDATLMDWATARDNVALPLRLRGVARAAARVRATAMLAQVGLGDRAGSFPHALSGGMRMRVSLARALAPKPKLLLMDEPFAALDEFTRHALQDDLRALWRQTGITILLVTHSIDEASFLATRLLLMQAHPGRVIAECSSPAPGAARDDPRRLGFVAEVARRLAQAGA